MIRATPAVVKPAADAPKGAPAPAKANPNASREGIKPVDKEGKPLNLSFEDGTLKDWKAEGKAFDGSYIARAKKECTPPANIDFRMLGEIV